MAEKAILYDATKCTACRGCQAACKEWNDLKADETVNTGSYENPPDLTPRTWLKMRFNELETDTGLAWLFTRRACMHCTEAGCVKVCPTKAVYHHDLGFVAYNKEICSGCGYCVDACPFNVPRMEGSSLTGKKKMDKCLFCIDRVTNGLEPACVKTCPPGALAFGERQDMLDAADRRISKLAEQGIEANLYGRNELQGLHVMYLLAYPVADHKLPANPEVSPSVTLWQDILQPVGYAAVGLVAAGLAMNYMVARIRMVKEKEGR
jgi:formate dehydrogenase iron-sulfur subunit